MTPVRYLVQATAAAALTVCCAFASATPIAGTASGLVAPTTIITFSELKLAQDTVVTTQYSTLGATFDPGLFFSPVDPDAINGYNAVNGNALGNFYSAQAFDNADAPAISPIVIRFTSPQTSAAFGLAANGTSFTFTALRNNIPVESFFVAAADSDDVGGVVDAYYGFTGVTFDSIAILSNMAPADFFLVDNVQFGAGRLVLPNAGGPAAVPEPDVAALLGLGILGTAASRRRARRTA